MSRIALMESPLQVYPELVEGHSCTTLILIINNRNSRVFGVAIFIAKPPPVFLNFADFLGEGI
jgi:hypothetical protein